MKEKLKQMYEYFDNSSVGAVIKSFGLIVLFVFSYLYNNYKFSLILVLLFFLFYFINFFITLFNLKKLKISSDEFRRHNIYKILVFILSLIFLVAVYLAFNQDLIKYLAIGGCFAELNDIFDKLRKIYGQENKDLYYLFKETLKGISKILKIKREVEKEITNTGINIDGNNIIGNGETPKE